MPEVTSGSTGKRPAWLSELRSLVALSWPLAVGNLTQIGMGTTDVMMMGSLGPNTLAAGALGTNLYFMTWIFGIGLLNAVAPMIARELGRGSPTIRGVRKIVQHGAHDIGVFHWEGEFYAYSNFCLHQGGPACEGLTIAKVEERLRPDKTSQGLYFSETQMNFVCPWHGMEYDMKTGECISDRKMKLKKYQVLEKGDEVYVVA